MPASDRLSSPDVTPSSAAVDVALERAARGRPERSVVLVGLRGVGKTVLLNALRSRAIDRLWGTAKLEVRPGHSIRRPVASAMHLAVRDIGARHRDPARVEAFLGVLKAFALRSNPDDAKLRDRWQPGIDVAAAHGRADTGDIEIDLLEVLVDAAELARDVGTGWGCSSTRCRTSRWTTRPRSAPRFTRSRSRGCRSCWSGRGLPHVPATLSASKSYSERLFRYVRVDRLDQVAAERAWVSPAREEGVEFTPEALAALYEATDGYPYFVQAYGKSVWDVAPDVADQRGRRCRRCAVGPRRPRSRLLRVALRARHAGRAGVPARDGRPGLVTADGGMAPSRRPTSPPCSDASRRRCRRRATRC